MSEYIDKNEAVGEGYLADWYIHSVAEYDDEKLNEPRWTEKHIEELTQDFIVIPKDTPVADVAPVVHAYWKGYHTQEPCCSNVYNRQITEKTRKCAGVKRRKGKADNVARQTNRRADNG